MGVDVQDRSRRDSWTTFLNILATSIVLSRSLVDSYVVLIRIRCSSVALQTMFDATIEFYNHSGLCPVRFERILPATSRLPQIREICLRRS